MTYKKKGGVVTPNTPYVFVLQTILEAPLQKSLLGVFGYYSHEAE